MSPVGSRLAREGMVTEAFKAFYTARASGGVGLIILEPCFIEPEGEAVFLSLHEDRFIPGLRELVNVVHARGAHIGVQLYHAGWQQGKSEARFLPPIPPAELSVDRIHQLERKFVEAAGRAQEAGFDLIEIHAAHGYLLSQFLSPRGNRRTDTYGLDIKGRVRFVEEVVRGIRQEVGTSLLLSCRINGAENLPDGQTLEDTTAMAPILERAGLDLISVSAGALGSYPLTIPPSDTPQGCYVHLAEGVRGVLNVPVITAGRINSPEMAEEVLKSGKADLVAMGRGLIADPSLPAKAEAGQEGRIRKCIACNVCLDSDYDGHITCTVNAQAGREAELVIRSAAQPKRVMVIGGGLAGLEAARVAASRGHQVTVYEKEGTIGGQWQIAACPPHKREFKNALDWLEGELAELGVGIELCSPVTPEFIESARPDAVIVATGAVPVVPRIPGIDSARVAHAWDALLDRVPIGDRVLVIGGGATGLETAEYLAERGKNVSVVEMLKAFGSDMGGTVYFHLRVRLKQSGVQLFRNTEVKEISQAGVTIVRDGQEEEWEGFDTIVLALGVRSAADPAQGMHGRVNELYVIGDAVCPGRGVDAVRQGMEVGLKL